MGGISRISIEGTLSLVFRPESLHPPFFGGLEIYFINPPVLDLQFYGAGRLADAPTVRPIVRSTIEALVASILVLPNRYAIDLDEQDSVDIADLQHGDPHFVLRLTV